MVLTKQYLRYTPAGVFNIIASSKCNIAFVSLEGQIGRFVAVGACEHIIIWDLRLGEKARVLPGEKAEVTALCASPSKRHLAAGYSDGTIQIYDLKSAEVLSVFAGHKSEVTVLKYDSLGHTLASGSKDNDIILWDTVSEQGLCRLLGHRGPITDLVFMSQHSVVISSSKDSLVKFWELDTQHCFKTLTGHPSEVWQLCLVKNETYLVTGCADADLRVWKISLKDDLENRNPIQHLAATLERLGVDNDDSDDLGHPMQCVRVGALLRTGKGRVVSLVSDSSAQVIGCHGTDHQVELFYLCGENDATMRMKKRLKKQRKKSGDAESGMETDTASQEITLSDEVRRLSAINVTGKSKSVDLILGNGGELRVAVNVANNTVELYTTQTSVKHPSVNCLRAITAQGHRGKINAVAFSSDNLTIVSGGGDSVKLWNRATQTCLKTVEAKNVMCLTFVPGDKHVLAGLQDGTLRILDIATGDVLEEIPAHNGELKTICLLPNLSGCATGGSDKTVKFWQFELIVDTTSETNVRVLSLVHTRTLELEDVVLCVKISANNQFIAVALLDTTVKIFFVDSFKFHLELYGHKLPISCMDISSDSTLIVTGSGDRNVKIWGMDFGDCHKSLFAHDDTVTAVQFVPKTHYFFTCGKDGQIKEWDADRFNKIVTLQGHVGEAYSLAVSPNGQFVVSCGSDRVLRFFEKSDQILVLEDEEQEEREEVERLRVEAEVVMPGQPGLAVTSKRTVGGQKAADSIIECLDICEEYREELARHEALQAASNRTVAAPVLPTLMQAFNVATPDDFLLETMRRIRPSDLEETLLILPFTKVTELLQNMSTLVSRGDNTELLVKICIFVLKLHHAAIVANETLLPTLTILQNLLMEQITKQKDIVGFNLFGMEFLQREIEKADGVQLFRDMTRDTADRAKNTNKRRVLKRSLTVLNT